MPDNSLKCLRVWGDKRVTHHRNNDNDIANLCRVAMFFAHDSKDFGTYILGVANRGHQIRADVSLKISATY
jgi:hypothetical protein